MNRFRVCKGYHMSVLNKIYGEEFYLRPPIQNGRIWRLVSRLLLFGHIDNLYMFSFKSIFKAFFHFIFVGGVFKGSAASISNRYILIWVIFVTIATM